MFYKFIIVIASFLFIVSLIELVHAFTSDRPTCKELGGKNIYSHTILVRNIPVDQYKCVIEGRKNK